MLDAGSLDPRCELTADLLGELGSDLVAEEGGHMFGFDGEDGLTILLHGSAGLTSWGRVGVEDHPSFRERDFAVVGQDYRRPVNLCGRQIRLSTPRWEDATPSIVLLGCPPCRSRSMPIAVITSPGS